jgi:NAD(P)-dependent dehydrogenase (short-subunit alcohol dehydrogenase family)
MSSYVSIQAFARLVQSQLSRIDIVILNAGVKNISFNLVKSTGHEEVFQVNYLSTMLLTFLIPPILKAKGPPGEPAHLTIVNAALTIAAAKSPKPGCESSLSFLQRPDDFLAREVSRRSSWHICSSGIWWIMSTLTM